MSDSNWSARDKALAGGFFLFSGAILAVALYWSGSLAGYQEGRSVEASARHEAQAKHRVEQACITLTGARLVECVYDETAASQEAKTGEQDLDAQQGMERWAFLMFIAAVSQTIVASGALFFLMKDLRQNRKSAEQQLRAYLSVNEFIWNAEKRDFALQIRWVSKGQTPAYKTDAWAKWAALDAQMADDFAFNRPSNFGHCPVTIGPDQPVFGTCKTGPDDSLMRDAAVGNTHIYLWGEVAYEDAFGFQRFSQIAVKVDVELLDSGGYVIRWASIPRHNESN